MPPNTYKKLVATQLSTDFRAVAQIVEADMPSPAEDEILVRNIYAAVNASDTNMSAGFYTPGTKPPVDLGAEAIGEVVAVGDGVKHLKAGDLVIAMKVGGGYCEYAIHKARYAVPIDAPRPEYLSLIVSGTTASLGLKTVGEMGSDETVLVTAAAGGTGQFAVQLAKLAGNHVIGTCSTDEKAALLKELGCDRVINYKTESVHRVLRSEYPKGVDVIYESVGGEMFDSCLKNLAVKGRLVIIGYITEYLNEAPEKVEDLRVYHRLLIKSASIRSMFLNHFMQEIPAHMMELMQLYGTGKLQVKIDPTPFHGLESVADAVDYLHSAQSMGKVVVQIAND